ncbi:GntR family transcriptional regulator [Microvirga brassicacearum]|uniref:GntR family transcriptional regulator n=1 Tax=Microvirga brassicacearum TaxID=2580413 RepID=A0A5N3PGM7_9HYPH|nr:GntR family transcriptional regulator [Microvirga brassicacearum]KAB0268884.1 GntR family transcriptional regulator [Microvirga brassicacearum]
MSQLLSGRVRAQSLVDVVTQRLEEAIMSGEFAPGSRLSEHALATSLGVSRGPLREAIRRLEGRKLVERTPNIGVHIAVLSLKDLADLLIVREALEGMACRLAAERMTDEELSGLDQLLEEHGEQESVRAGTGYYQEGRDFDFHFRIVKASGNAQLIQMLTGDLYDLLRVYRYKSSTLDGRAAKAFQEHKAVVAALKSRDPDKAEAAMRLHVRNARMHVATRMVTEEPVIPAPKRQGARAETPPSKQRIVRL